MICPKCRTVTLRSAELKGGVGEAFRCGSCHGMWVIGLEEGDIDAVSRSRLEENLPSHDRNSDRRAGLCPFGHGILRRAQTHLNPPFYLERCSICHGIWFDRGEWERVALDGLLKTLFDIWLPSWQQRKLDQIRQRRLVSEARERLGPELLESVGALGRALHGHPASSQAVALLIEVIRGELELSENSDG
jgi:Zn-finger nucleic acid-binding protein